MKEFDFELNELFEMAVGKLTNIEVYDSVAFDALLRKLSTMIDECKDEAMISRQILKCIQLAKSAVGNRVGYVEGINIKLVTQYEEMMTALTMNERIMDRTPGKPRVV